MSHETEVDKLESVLQSVKALLGIQPEIANFDSELIMFTNMALNTLTQLGVGPPTGYIISSKNNVWSEFLNDNILFEDVKSFVYLKVRLIFDPPTNAFLVKAIEDQIQELTWRLNVKGGAKS